MLNLCAILLCGSAFASASSGLFKVGDYVDCWVNHGWKAGIVKEPREHRWAVKLNGSLDIFSEELMRHRIKSWTKDDLSESPKILEWLEKQKGRVQTFIKDEFGQDKDGLEAPDTFAAMWESDKGDKDDKDDKDKLSLITDFISKRTVIKRHRAPDKVSIPGREKVKVYTTEEVLQSDDLKRSLLIAHRETSYTVWHTHDDKEIEYNIMIHHKNAEKGGEFCIAASELKCYDERICNVSQAHDKELGLETGLWTQPTDALITIFALDTSHCRRVTEKGWCANTAVPLSFCSE